LVILFVKQDSSLENSISPFGKIIVQEAVSKMGAKQKRHRLHFNGPVGRRGNLENIPLISSAGVELFTDQLISLLKEDVTYSILLKSVVPRLVLTRFLSILWGAEDPWGKRMLRQNLNFL